MNPLLKELPADLQKKLVKRSMPAFEKPMLATLTKYYFSDPEWIYERKFDGVRVLLFKDGKKAWLKSRNDNSLDQTYPEVLQALQDLPVNQIIIDSELISFKGKVSSFEKLQARIGVKNPSAELIKKIKVYVYIFDILYLDGYELLHLPLIKRKTILKHAMPFHDPLRYVIHRNTEGVPLFKQACKKGWEGLIAKNRESTYVHVRSQNWLKFKCIQEQEMVVGGYTSPAGSRVGFGALLVGYYKDGKLHYAGKVGTGYNEDFLQKFAQRLQKIETKKSPFSNTSAIKDTDVHFVHPDLVVEIGFEEWTRNNKLRQPRFLGVRDDKNPKDVVKETPQNIVPPHED